MLGRILGYIHFFFSYRHKVYSLRRRYDRAREKADKIRNAEKRLYVLRILDQIEPTLVMLEEQRISRWERGRMIRHINNGVSQARAAMKGKLKQQLPMKK